MIGVILALIAVQLGGTSLRQTDRRVAVVAIGFLGLVANLAVVFLVGVSQAVTRWADTSTAPPDTEN